MSNSFPWYFHLALEPVKTTFFFHLLMNRAENNAMKEGIVNSNVYELFKNLFIVEK